MQSREGHGLPRGVDNPRLPAGVWEGPQAVLGIPLMARRDPSALASSAVVSPNDMIYLMATASIRYSTISIMGTSGIRRRRTDSVADIGSMCAQVVFISI